MKQKIEIIIEGDDQGDLEIALEEAMRKIQEGYTSGADRNDTGSYSFDVSEEEE